MTPIAMSGNGSKMPGSDTMRYKRNMNYDDKEFRESRRYRADTKKKMNKYGNERQPLIDTCVDDDLDSENSASGYLNSSQSLLADYACNPRYSERYSVYWSNRNVN